MAQITTTQDHQPAAAARDLAAKGKGTTLRLVRTRRPPRRSIQPAAARRPRWPGQRYSRPLLARAGQQAGGLHCPDAEEARHRQELARETGDPKRLRQWQPHLAERRDDPLRHGDERHGGPFARGARRRGGGNGEYALIFSLVLPELLRAGRARTGDARGGRAGDRGSPWSRPEVTLPPLPRGPAHQAAAPSSSGPSGSRCSFAAASIISATWSGTAWWTICPAPGSAA